MKCSQHFEMFSQKHQSKEVQASVLQRKAVVKMAAGLGIRDSPGASAPAAQLPHPAPRLVSDPGKAGRGLRGGAAQRGHAQG